MKKAVVVGGSNGIGLAITKNLIARGYRVCILDICEPDATALGSLDNYIYYACDLLHLNEALIEQIAADEDVSLLMITAGFGRVADFDCGHRCFHGSLPVDLCFRHSGLWP